MGMGTRKAQEKQEDIWIASGDVARSPGHPFYLRLNELLDEEKFDEFVESAISRALIASVASHGVLPIRWRYGSLSASELRSRRRITRPSRGRGG